MYIGQIAKQQRMMYQFINRGTGDSAYQTQMRSQLSGGYGATKKASGNDDALNALRSMGFSGTEGRTIREIAQRRMQEAQRAKEAQSEAKEELAAEALKQRVNSRQQYTPISDKATKAMQDLALEDAKNSVSGSAKTSSADRANLIREQLKDVEPSKRAASFNTMNKVWQSETDRIAEHIKEKDSNWKSWGDKFDTDILKDYKPGVNVWV